MRASLQNPLSVCYNKMSSSAFLVCLHAAGNSLSGFCDMLPEQRKQVCTMMCAGTAGKLQIQLVYTAANTGVGQSIAKAQ